MVAVRFVRAGEDAKHYPAHQRHDSRMQPCDDDLSSARNKSDAQRKNERDQCTNRANNETITAIMIDDPLCCLHAGRPISVGDKANRDTASVVGKRGVDEEEIKISPIRSRWAKGGETAFNHTEL